MKNSILVLCLTLTLVNVGFLQVSAFDLGEILRNIKKEDINSLVQDENVKKISNNALGFVEDFANNPENRENINNILNTFGGLDQLGSSPFNLNNILNQLNNSPGGPNIINHFLSSLTSSGSSNQSISLSQLGTELTNFLVTVYMRSLVGPPLTNDQIASMVSEFIGNITNHNQQVVDYVNQRLPGLLAQFSPTMSPADILAIINTNFDFSIFMNNNSTDPVNSTDVNTLINLIMQTFLTRDISALQSYISNLNANQIQQLMALFNDPAALQTWLRQLDLSQIRQLADVLGNSAELNQILGLFNSDSRLQALGSMIAQLVQSPQFQQLLSSLGNGDIMNLITSFNSTNLVDILMSLNSTEWQLLINIINNPNELQNLMSLFNNTAFQQVLDMINNSPQIKQLLSMLDIATIQNIIKAFNFTINPNGSFNLYITTDLQNLLAGFVDPQLLNQLMQNFNWNDLQSLIQTLNTGLLDQLFNMYNISGLTRDHLEEFIPMLVQQLAAANSSSEVMNILQQTLMVHLSYYLNDTSIFNTTNPWLTVMMRAIDMITQNQDLLMKIEPYLAGLDLAKINDMLTLLNNLDLQNLGSYIPSDFLAIVNQLTNANKLSDLFTLFGMPVPSWALQYVDVYLPQLIESVLKANGSEEMMKILESGILSQLAMVFNDTSLLNSTNPWMNIAVNALNMALNDPQLMASLQVYVQQCFQGFNMSQLNDLVDMLRNLDMQNLGTLIPEEVLRIVEGLVNAQNIQELLMLFNVTVPDWAVMFVEGYLPQLISELARANSSDQMAQIVERTLLYQLSMLLNDSSILTSPSPWTQIAMDAYYMIMNDPMILMQIQSYLGQFNLTELERAILENLVQRYPSIYVDLLMVLVTPENLNYAINCTLGYFNLTLSPRVADHIASFLPQMLMNLANANSTDQMIQIVETTVLSNLAGLFNDPNIMTDPSFYLPRDIFYVIRDDPQLMAQLALDPMMQNMTVDFLNYYFATRDLMGAANNVSGAIAQVAAAMLADPMNTMVVEYAPELYQQLSVSTSEAQSMDIIGTYLTGIVRSVFPPMPTTTTTTTTTTSTTTTSTTTTTTTRPTTTTTTRTTTTTTTRPTTTRLTTTTTRTTVTQTLNSNINNLISSLQSRATTRTAPTRSLQPLRTLIFVKK